MLRTLCPPLRLQKSMHAAYDSGIVATSSCFGSTATANSPYFADPTGFGGQRRNQFTGPGYFNTDFTAQKGFKVPGLEGGLFQIGVQAYNVLNHPNFQAPSFTGNMSLVAPPNEFGVIPGTVIPNGSDQAARVLQGALRLEF